MTTMLPNQASLPRPEPDKPRKPWYRRAAVLVPLVVVVVTVTVLATVLVVAGEDRTVGGTAQAPAVTSVQLRATVTSALTGEPLAVTVALPDGTNVSAAANGTVAADTVSPGDQVTVSAKGHLAAQVAVGADRTITATLQPTLATVTTQLNTWAEQKNADAIIDWVFSPATGLEFTPVSDGTVSWDGSLSVAREVVGQVAIVNMFLSPGIIAEEETVQEWFDGKATRVTLAGQPAWHGPSEGDGASSFWIRSPLMIDVSGIDLSTTDAVLAAIIAAQPAR